MTGDVREVGGKFVVRFERHMTHSEKEVWDFLTLADKTRTWLAESDIETVVGGTVQLLFKKSGGATVTGVVRTLEEPLIFTHTWNDPGSHVRWELTPDSDGCTLVLNHTVLTKEKISETVAAWHLHIDALSFALAGADIEWPVDRFEELKSKYLRMFG